MSDLRTADGRPAKYMDCYVCSTPLLVGQKTRNPQRCFNCGIKRMLSAMHQMIDKSGPDYEKWRGGMLAHADKLRTATPPPSEN